MPQELRLDLGSVQDHFSPEGFLQLEELVHLDMAFPALLTSPFRLSQPGYFEMLQNLG